MTTCHRRTALAAAVMLLGGCSDLEAQQDLAGRVASAPDGRVQFTFPARTGVCGDGRTFVTIDDDTHIGVFVSSDGARAACVPGPVRVVLERADRQVVGVRAFVGPVDTATAGTTSLGAVSAPEAAAYLLDLARTLDGAAGRDAIMPAAIADGDDARSRLAAIARDAGRPVDTRRSAMSWLARQSTTPGAAREAERALTQLAEDDAQPRAVREQALSSLGRLVHGAGLARIIALTQGGSDQWLTRQAVAVLARSGDPRARAHLRQLVQRAALGDAALASAVRSLGGRYGNAGDEALVRGAFPRFAGTDARRAAISVLAERGGAANVRWLLQVAADPDQPEPVRRSAVSGARRAGASSAELAQLYDRGDGVTRGLAVSALGAEPDAAAVDKLLAIARSGDDRTLRRRAINALGKVDDPRVRAALTEIVVR